MDVTELTLLQILKGLKDKKFSSREVVFSCLERIEDFDSDIGSFLTVLKEKALEEAREADARIKELGADAFLEHPLLGIPIAHKDLYSIKGIKTTAAAKLLENYIPQYSATAVNRLNNAGTITLGKLNCDAWAHGSSGENSDFYPTRNPWDKEYVSGGSSSGSGASVAACFVPAATATDTGGSIRLPASFCGVVGIKPTYGRVSRYGVIAMASSLDSMGFMTRTVEDAALLLGVGAGKDPHDATTIDAGVPDYLSTIKGGVKGLKIGLPKEYFAEGVSAEVREKVLAAVKTYEDLGAVVQEVSLPHTEYSIPVYYIIMSSEVSSNLARYDGIRYGHTRDYFGEEAKRRIMLGTHALSSGYKDKYYGRATEVRALIKQDFEKVFKDVDLLLAPVSPTPPFKLGEKTADPLLMYMSDILLAAVNLAGIPALSLPCGFTDNNLPIGMQLIGPRLSENILFQTGYAYQEATDWHTRKPKL